MFLKLGELIKESCHLTFVDFAIFGFVNFVEHIFDIALGKALATTEGVLDKFFRLFKRQVTVFSLVVLLPHIVYACAYEPSHHVVLG